MFYKGRLAGLDSALQWRGKPPEVLPCELDWTWIWNFRKGSSWLDRPYLNFLPYWWKSKKIQALHFSQAAKAARPWPAITAMLDCQGLRQAPGWFQTRAPFIAERININSTNPLENYCRIIWIQPQTYDFCRGDDSIYHLSFVHAKIQDVLMS